MLTMLLATLSSVTINGDDNDVSVWLIIAILLIVLLVILIYNNFPRRP